MAKQQGANAWFLTSGLMIFAGLLHLGLGFWVRGQDPDHILRTFRLVAGLCLVASGAIWWRKGLQVRQQDRVERGLENGEF